jgi:hypothetical protein
MVGVHDAPFKKFPSQSLKFESIPIIQNQIKGNITDEILSRGVSREEEGESRATKSEDTGIPISVLANGDRRARRAMTTLKNSVGVAEALESDKSI